MPIIYAWYITFAYGFVVLCFVLFIIYIYISHKVHAIPLPICLGFTSLKFASLCTAGQIWFYLHSCVYNQIVERSSLTGIPLMTGEWAKRSVTIVWVMSCRMCDTKHHISGNCLCNVTHRNRIDARKPYLKKRKHRLQRIVLSVLVQM